MNEQTLQHMHQAWQQGNDDYEQDWKRFVEFAARMSSTPEDDVMAVLRQCRWFKIK